MNKNKNKFGKKNFKSNYKILNFYPEMNFQMNIK